MRASFNRARFRVPKHRTKAIRLRQLAARLRPRAPHVAAEELLDVQEDAGRALAAAKGETQQ